MRAESPADATIPTMATRAPRAAGVEGASDELEAARDVIRRNDAWYHTLELAPGILTPGRIDLRKVAGKLLPDNLSGMRALDVGTFDGFWAFELEKRGAEVVAIDLDAVAAAQLPPNNRAALEETATELRLELGQGFKLASAHLRSDARLVSCDVLDLTTEKIGGPVDIAFMGALLVHLRDPVRALERIRATLVPGGRLLQLEGVSLRLSLLHPRRPVANLQTLDTQFNWWYPNHAALKAWLRTAGFAEITDLGLYHPPQRRPMADWYRGLGSRRPH
jgi:SAM-dependent methyltransferase